MTILSRLMLLGVLAVSMFGCSLITLPLDAVDAAYQVTKGVVKGTVAVVDAVTPDLNSNKNDTSDKAEDASKK